MNRGIEFIALRIVFLYLFILWMMRGAGKRTFGSLHAVDFVLVLIMSDMLDDIVWGEVSTAKGVAGLGVLFLMDTLAAAVMWKSRTIRSLLIGEPAVLIREGRWDTDMLRKTRVTRDVKDAIMRRLHLESADEARQVAIEPDGKPSGLRKNGYKPAQKIDLEQLRKVLR